MIARLGHWWNRAAWRAGAVLLAPLFILALAGCSRGGSEAPADGPPPNPLLYEIASADGTVEGWMLGTIHALPPDTAWRTATIADVVARADLLVVEIGQPRRPGEGAAVFSDLAQSPGLPPLAQRLPADLRPQLAALLDRGGIAAGDLASRETWAAAIALARIDATGDPAHGVDRALLADFAGRPVRELEGLRAQLAIFDRLPEAQQRIILAAVVRESERTRRDPGRLQRAWLAGDAGIMEQSTQEGFLADPYLRAALLTDRNQRWASALVPLLEQPARPLIAVGTAHLVGPEGLVALLEAGGYRLSRIP